MVEYAERVQGDLDLGGQLQRFQHPLRQLELGSSNLPVVSDMSIRTVLEHLKISIFGSRACRVIADQSRACF